MMVRGRGESISELSEAMKTFFGNVRDNGILSGVDLVRSILTIFRNYGFTTQVIASSMRNARQVREVAELGVHIATLPFYVIKEMIQHPKTLEGIKRFTQDVVPSYERIFQE
ncbi:MAG: transaldolase family protein [Thermoproteota archaeon]